MIGGGERATHNCIERMRSSLVKVARLCADRHLNIPAELIPTSSSFIPAADILDLSEFSNMEYDSSIWANACILDEGPPATVPAASVPAVAAAPAVMQILPASPPSPTPAGSVIITGTTPGTGTATSHHVPTPLYVPTPPVYVTRTSGLVVVNHTARHSRPVLMAIRNRNHIF